MEYRIREDVQKHMEELRQWLETQEDVPLEEMSAFFTARLHDYEDHMMLWEEGYRLLAGMIPPETKNLLDLGCGTGLELDALFRLRKDISVTGIDLCQAMLEKLREKHPQVLAVRGDYFTADLGREVYDCIISFESLHHFSGEKKLGLFKKIYEALKPGGVYLEVDYLAACPEEETLLMDFCCKKRAREGIPENVFVHFDTPLTVEHELELLKIAGFPSPQWLKAIEGASFLRCEK